jgi:tRNA CCA-adding enzyme
MNKKVYEEILELISPEKEKIEFIEKSLKEFLSKINLNIKKAKIKAEIFVGGSFAKKTLIKKDKYDVDVFLRFDKKYEDKTLSELTEKLLKGFLNVIRVHGSRDYFRINYKEDFFIELIPVLKVNKPKDARNITDLSYSHVKYIQKKIKTQKILNEIMIAKAFCHAKNCYGAEGYIRGFSGYSLELLVYYFGSFEKFVKAIVNSKEKIVIDIEKDYKNKQQILLDLNGSKLISPIILIDPTFKQRNASAALSDETFLRFKKDCANFLKNPSVKEFERKKTDLETIKKNALKNKREFILVEISTKKDAGDVAGTKLFKFYNHLIEEISRFFDIFDKGFSYNKKQSSKCFFVVKKKNEIVFSGPNAKDQINAKKFREEHKKVFVKKGNLFAKEKFSLGIKEFLEKWKIKNSKKITEMAIENLKTF